MSAGYGNVLQQNGRVPKWTLVSFFNGNLSKKRTDAYIGTLPYYYILDIGCLLSQQHARISQGQICSHNCLCCLSGTDVADQTCHTAQSQCIVYWEGPSPGQHWHRRYSVTTFMMAEVTAINWRGTLTRDVTPVSALSRWCEIEIRQTCRGTHWPPWPEPKQPALDSNLCPQRPG